MYGVSAKERLGGPRKRDTMHHDVLLSTHEASPFVLGCKFSRDTKSIADSSLPVSSSHTCAGLVFGGFPDSLWHVSLVTLWTGITTEAWDLQENRIHEDARNSKVRCSQ